jgi:hypothetical protein
MKRAFVAVAVVLMATILAGAVSPTQAYYKKSYKSYKKPVAKRASYHAHVYGGATHRYMAANAEGRVLLTWSTRSGATCHIAYGEGKGIYQYRSAAPCNDGSVVIGGLQPGVMYSFAVNPDHQGWQGVRQKSARATATAMPIAKENVAWYLE